MIRVSIDVPGDREDRLQFLVDMADTFVEQGVIVGYRLPNATLRIVRHDTAMLELSSQLTARSQVPLIVYEAGESAFVANNHLARQLMAHPDVKFWLKSNTFRDYSLNNEKVIDGQLHFALVDRAKRIGTAEDVQYKLTESMAAKIRLLPIVPLDRFSPYREARIDWSQKRAIDVNFIGMVDYGLQAQDFWDEKFDEAQGAPTSFSDTLLDHHRREAILQLTDLKHLRVFVGMNKGIVDGLYLTAMLRSSVVVSPWGAGESSLRDYEAILAGAILVKPGSDHVLTFPPDIYQSKKYYVSCAHDFSDLHDVVRSIMTDRERAISVARDARCALLRENTSDRILDYFVRIFREATGATYEGLDSRAIPSPRAWTSSILSLFDVMPEATRGTLHKSPASPDAVRADVSFIFTEDNTPENSHDIRMARSDVAMSGLYRLRCIVRPLERRSIAIMVHYAWRDGALFAINLATGELLADHVSGTGISVVGKPKVVRGPGEWRAISAFVRIDRLLPRDLSIVLYAATDTGKQYYSGDGKQCFELAAFDIDRISEFGEGSDTF